MKNLKSKLTWAAIAGPLILLIGLSPTVMAQSQSSDATLSGLTLSGIDLGGGVGRNEPVRDGRYRISEANVYHSVSETTVTPKLNDPNATYVVKLGGVVDSDGTVSLAVGRNVITVEVTAEDGNNTRTYTATVNRASESDPTTGELPTDSPRLNFRVVRLSTNRIALLMSIPRNRGITTWVVKAYKKDGDDFVAARGGSRSIPSSRPDLGGQSQFIGTSSTFLSGTLYKFVLTATNSQGSTVIEQSVTAHTASYGVFSTSSEAVQADATLSDLTLTGVDEYTQESSSGSTFWSEAQSYKTQVPNSLSQTTVTPTKNQTGASYVIKIGGETDSDGTVDLDEGENIITVEVTAEDGTHFRIYNVAVTRRAVKIPATGAPTISGTAQVGQTLTADTSEISDADGLDNVSYSYQWLADDAEIDGATSSTYTVQSSDNGKVIKVRVSFTDDWGYDESLTSIGTSAVVLGGL